jgi:hypothetical protein
MTASSRLGLNLGESAEHEDPRATVFGAAVPPSKSRPCHAAHQRRESRSLPASIDDARFVCAVMAKALDGMEVAYDPPDEFRIWCGGNGLSASELGSWRGLSTGADVHQIRGSSDQR